MVDRPDWLAQEALNSAARTIEELVEKAIQATEHFPKTYFKEYPDDGVKLKPGMVIHIQGGIGSEKAEVVILKPTGLITHPLITVYIEEAKMHLMVPDEYSSFSSTDHYLFFGLKALEELRKVNKKQSE